MSSTPLTKDPSPSELICPAMPGQEEFRYVGYKLIDLMAQYLYQVRLRRPYQRVSNETRQALDLLPLPRKWGLGRRDHGILHRTHAALPQLWHRPPTQFRLESRGT